MDIQRFDSPYRFLVRSNSKPDQHHLVDLLENECSCEAWTFKKQADCKHIKSCKLHLIETILSHARTHQHTTEG